jgi:hypothetical protein
MKRLFRAQSAPPEGEGAARRDLWLALIPVIILSLVALNQVRAAQTEQLSAWKGGGFGMFSGVDRDYYRAFRAQATDQAGNKFDLDMDSIDRALESDFSIDFQQMYKNVRSYPSEAHLQQLIDVMGAAQWNFAEDGKSAKVSGWGGDRRGTFAGSSIELQMYRVTYNKETNMVEPQLLTTFTGTPNE